jgi:hypothetical protein
MMPIFAPHLILPPEKPALVRASDLRGVPAASEAQRRIRASFPILFVCPSLPQTLIPQSSGTAIGNMTGGGGLAEGFDGDTSVAAANCASNGAGITCFIGKRYTTQKQISGFKYWPSNDQGVHAGAGDQELQVWVKSGSDPSTDIDGTFIGGTAAAADTTSMQQNLSLTKTFADRVWVRVISTGVITTKYCAEVEFYEN